MPLHSRVAAHAYGLDGLEHRDPADRLLIASAIDLACPLVTYDDRIVRFERNTGGDTAFAVTA